MIDQNHAMADSEPKSTQLREVIVEFGRHLDILADQLGASVMEADRDCVSVGESFHEMAAARATLDAVECPEPERTVVQESSKQIGESLHTAVVALQYHDRLSQRLCLVRAGLDRLQTLLHDESPRSYDEWLESLRDVERVNRIEQQRLGPAPENAISGPAGDMSQSSVELF